MKHEFAYEEAQRHLKQRNRFAALASVLGLTSLLAVGAAATREESMILVPVTSERLTLGSGATDAHYLELVTRDTALMLLNRAPESLDYWMEQVLKVADPSAHGRLKAELVKIVDEQRGSDISQAFVISRTRDLDRWRTLETLSRLSGRDEPARQAWSRRQSHPRPGAVG
jgi:conjugal transfer pilus assembly protein TraE